MAVAVYVPNQVRSRRASDGHILVLELVKDIFSAKGLSTIVFSTEFAHECAGVEQFLLSERRDRILESQRSPKS